MTGGRQRRRRRRREKARQGSTSTVTHISSLGQDVVLEIFLRLSSLATLVRAALTCRAWRRAVASSPDFRRRFRALHPAPPLLGIFVVDSTDGSDALYRAPSFVPCGFRDWDLAGAVRGGDFFLTSLLERSTKTSYPYWQILDCCGGRILLTDNLDQDKPLIVLNPLMRRSEREFRYPDPGPKQYKNQTTPRFICQDEDPPSSFRVALLAYGGCTMQASVFSSDTGEWSDLPAVDFPARLADDGTSGEAWIENRCRMHVNVNGFVYWIYGWRGHEYDVDEMSLISLDTTTMEFSFAELPQCLRSPECRFTFHGGDTEDGAACIVYSDGCNKLGVVKHTMGEDGIERWVPDRVLSLEGELKRLNLESSPYYRYQFSLLAVRDGYVYFSLSEPETMYEPGRGCSWFLSLCLATVKVKKLFDKSYDDEAYVYIMPWPPCLLAAGNDGELAFEGAP